MKKIERRIRYILFLAFLILNGGCKEDKGTPIIKKDRMVEILADIHLVQAVLDQEPMFPQGAKREYYYCNIFERHEVTEEEFDSAITWYAANMDIFEQVYAEVIARLEREKAELEEVK